MSVDNHYYSEEAKDILEKIPSRIIRYGINSISFVFLALIFGCYFIRFPEKVTGPIFITTNNAPIDVIPKISGTLGEVFVKNNMKVKKGEIIAVVASTLPYETLRNIENKILINKKDSLCKFVFNSKLYESYNLGELQNSFSIFIENCSKYKRYINRNVLKKKKELISQLISKNEEYHDQLIDQQKNLSKEFFYKKKAFIRDSLLYVEKLISLSEYEKSIQLLLQNKKNKMSFESQITKTELSIIKLKQQLIELSLQYSKEEAIYEQSIRTSMFNFEAELKKWKFKYLLVSPIDGTVSFVKQWNKKQFIKKTDIFITILPNKAKEIIGVVKLGQERFGRVKLGQKVNVKLRGFPYLEYGTLEGIVEYISSVPNEKNNYIIEVAFPKGMLTSYKKELNFIQRMDGDAEIITKKKRLAMRFLEPVISLFDKGL